MKEMKNILLFVVLLAYVGHVFSYKILLIVPPPVRSHYILVKAQADILHEHGHEVTLISSFKSEKPLYREIDTGLLDSIKPDASVVSLTVTKFSNIMGVAGILKLVQDASEIMFKNEDIRKLLDDKTETFDLVIMEHFVNDMLIGFGVRFDCPVILNSPVGLPHWVARITGNPDNPDVIPHLLLPFAPRMELWQRALNTVMFAFDEVFDWFVVHPAQEKMYKMYFPEEAKRVPYSQLPNKVALAFLNSHPSIGIARPLLPNSVEVGGYHIQKAKPLPEDLQTLLDSNKHGAIFFSMGSNLKSADFSPALKQGLINFFGKLKQTVLWKFEEDLPGKPDNVIISKWLPQSSILGHPNLKAFVSHGGLLSITEATSAGVPLVVIPIFGDQRHNAAAVEERHQGIMLDYNNFTHHSLEWALGEVLTNPRYTLSAKKIQKNFLDRPVNPRESINYYSELVIRSGGARHLSHDRPSFISHVLIVHFLAALPLLLFLALVSCCRKCLKKCCCEKTEKLKKN